MIKAPVESTTGRTLRIKWVGPCRLFCRDTSSRLFSTIYCNMKIYVYSSYCIITLFIKNYLHYKMIIKFTYKLIYIFYDMFILSVYNY